MSINIGFPHKGPDEGHPSDMTAEWYRGEIERLEKEVANTARPMTPEQFKEWLEVVSAEAIREADRENALEAQVARLTTLILEWRSVFSNVAIEGNVYAAEQLKRIEDVLGVPSSPGRPE